MIDGQELNGALMPRGFQRCMQGEAGHRLHYVIGGQGSPVLLVPGWPQTWLAWRKIMPALAERFTVVAVDPPGLGDSDKPTSGYDTDAVSTRLHALTQALGWDRFHYVGHDVGVWIGYPFAHRYARQLRSLTLLDATIPGVVPKEMYAFEETRIAKNWHFFFNALVDLPELLVGGRERAFLSWLFHSKSTVPGAIAPAAMEEYVRCYSAPGGWRGGVAYYRALFQDMEQNRAHAKKRLTLPILAVGGESALGPMMEQMLSSVADGVTGLVVPGCGHYIPEEAPTFLIDRLMNFLET